MEEWILAAVVAASVTVFAVLLLVIRWWRKGWYKESAETRRIANLQVGRLINKHKNTGWSVHHDDHHDHLDMRKVNYYALNRELSMKRFFNWADHPSLATQAVEHGWPRFAFTGHTSISSSCRSTPSNLLGTCVCCDQSTTDETSWEIASGSADIVQKVRLKSGSKKAAPRAGVYCVTKSALPLPGPFLELGNFPFPQQAYFEINLVTNYQQSDALKKPKESNCEDENIKLVQKVGDANDHQSEDELKVSSTKEVGIGKAVAASVGLSIGDSPPRRLPGSYYGSIGFNSDGSVYLDGIKVVNETEKAEWGSTDRTVGCGFDPANEKVFFTLDYQLVHAMDCKSIEFSRPLYPTVAANVDILFLVNLGQMPFKYAPGNVHRVSNPCFTISASPSIIGYEDSKELFSMGRIDSEWLNLNRCTTNSSQSTNNSDNRTYENDQVSEADLFEIVLDNMTI